MINFNLSISNPWSDHWAVVYTKTDLLNKYTAWEFNVYSTHYLLDADFRLTVTGDHPGVFITVGLFGYSVEFNLYDTRHGDMR